MMVRTGFRSDYPEFLPTYQWDNLMVLPNTLLDYQTHAFGLGVPNPASIRISAGMSGDISSKHDFLLSTHIQVCHGNSQAQVDRFIDDAMEGAGLFWRDTTPRWFSVPVQ